MPGIRRTPLPPARTVALTALALGALLLPGAGAATAATAPGCTAGTGPYQRPLERHLKLPVDGVQSPRDCAAIRRFQRHHGLRPARGYADLATYRTLLAVRARKNPNAAGKCPARSFRVTCVDLTRQLLWVQRGKKVRFGPVPVRTGREAQETRNGWHRIYWRSRDHKSTLYANAPMPYAQFFDGGQALHGRYGSLFDGAGSAGCVNLALQDAQRLWKLLGKGDRLYVWGAKPGTAG